LNLIFLGKRKVGVEQVETQRIDFLKYLVSEIREEKAEIEIASKAMDKPKTKAENETIIDRVIPDLTNI